MYVQVRCHLMVTADVLAQVAGRAWCVWVAVPCTRAWAAQLISNLGHVSGRTRGYIDTVRKHGRNAMDALYDPHARLAQAPLGLGTLPVTTDRRRRECAGIAHVGSGPLLHC
jgi:hypothetical protein